MKPSPALVGPQAAREGHEEAGVCPSQSEESPDGADEADEAEKAERRLLRRRSVTTVGFWSLCRTESPYLLFH